MAPINILKFPVSSPADTSALEELKTAGYNASQIMAVVGKSEGNGCVNDFSRTLSTVVWEPFVPSTAVTVFSGGTEGVLCPHITFIIRENRPTGLLAAVARTRILAPHEIGTGDHAKAVCETIEKMIAEIGVVDRRDVKLALVKCPLLTSAKIEQIKAVGKVPLTTDTYESMALSRHASAVGIGVAVGELNRSSLEHLTVDAAEWETAASCSSGAELEDCHILLLASDNASGGQLRAISTEMKDAIDAPAILAALKQIENEKGKLVQVFAKAEADPKGMIRGNRHTMSTDSDLHSTRHARAAVGGLLAGLTGDTQLYVSGGAEGQGPPGGGSVCLVYRI